MDPKPQLPAETIEFAHRMFDAARSGNSEVLVAALDAGLPTNILNEKGNSLLMLASYAGHTDLTKQLLDRGADPNVLNDLGQSMIAGAVFKAHDDVVRLLADRGADPRLGKPTAIQTAHMFGRTHLMGVLGAKDGDIGPEVPAPVSQAGSGGSTA
ncbi:unnamed protein product [Mycena citricolor]|uniref:Ankyrin n=1 Tax=Mycena citricolor TaxID=2018698 RepID=A0AAD2HZ28_9AGAR|nr:unnamed protein product [Mycena citricolor]CAK5284482.1 unnamed protein product [Mycena citricolor]